MFGEWFDSQRRGALAGGAEVREHGRPVGAEHRPEHGDPRRVRRATRTCRSSTRPCRATAPDFTYQNQLVNSVDTQDIPRFLSVNSSQTLMNAAYVFDMTTRGDSVHLLRRRAVPAQRHERRERPVQPPDDVVVQHDDDSVPKSISKLSALRHDEPGTALRLVEASGGSTTTSTSTSDSSSTAMKCSWRSTRTRRPATASPDLNTATGGRHVQRPAQRSAWAVASITVTNGHGSATTRCNSFTLGAGAGSGLARTSPSAPSTPRGRGTSIRCRAGTGDVVAVTGRGFGTATGTVTVGGVSATVRSYLVGRRGRLHGRRAPRRPERSSVVVTKSGGGASNGICLQRSERGAGARVRSP